MSSSNKGFCKGEGCKKLPSFGLPGDRPSYCASHKTSEMVDVKNRRCEFAGCLKAPNFSHRGTMPKYCHTHKTPGMVNCKGPFCVVENCEHRRSVARYCAWHLEAPTNQRKSGGGGHRNAAMTRNMSANSMPAHAAKMELQIQQTKQAVTDMAAKLMQMQECLGDMLKQCSKMGIDLSTTPASATTSTATPAKTAKTSIIGSLDKLDAPAPTTTKKEATTATRKYINIRPAPPAPALTPTSSTGTTTSNYSSSMSGDSDDEESDVPHRVSLTESEIGRVLSTPTRSKKLDSSSKTVDSESSLQQKKVDSSASPAAGVSPRASAFATPTLAYTGSASGAHPSTSFVTPTAPTSSIFHTPKNTSTNTHTIPERSSSTSPVPTQSHLTLEQKSFYPSSYQLPYKKRPRTGDRLLDLLAASTSAAEQPLALSMEQRTQAVRQLACREPEVWSLPPRKLYFNSPLQHDTQQQLESYTQHPASNFTPAYNMQGGGYANMTAPMPKRMRVDLPKFDPIRGYGF